MTRQLRGPYILVAFLILVAAGTTGAWFALHQRPEAGDIIDMVNIDGEHAVVVRAVRDEPKRSFLSLFSRRQGERWGALIPRYAAISDAHATVAATAGVVVVRTVANDQPTLLFFDGKRGNKLGRLEPLGQRRDPSGFVLPRVSMLAAGNQVFDLYGEDGRWAVLVAIDVEQGRELWRTSLEGVSIHEAELQGSQVRVHVRRGGEQPQVLVFDRDTGAPGEPLPGEPLPDGAEHDTAERPGPEWLPGWLAEARAMGVQGIHYLYATERQALVALDSETGRLLAAVALPGYVPIWPRHIAGGRIWVARGPTWAVLDARTLQPVAGAGASEAGTDIAAELGRARSAPAQP